MTGTPNPSLQDLKLWRGVDGRPDGLNQNQQFQEKSTWVLNKIALKQGQLADAGRSSRPSLPSQSLCSSEQWLNKGVETPELTWHWDIFSCYTEALWRTCVLLLYLWQWDTVVQSTPQTDFLLVCRSQAEPPLPQPTGSPQILGFRGNSRQRGNLREGTNFNKN